MTKPAVSYRIVPDRFGANAAKAAALTPKRFTALIREITERGKTNIVKRTPVGHFGALRGGYQTELRRPNTRHPVGVIANPIIYHDAAEEGRKAGRPPPTAALIPWVGSKLGVPPGPQRRSVAFLVARKIGKKGTEGAHMVEEGWAETRIEIKPRLKALGLRMVRELDK